VPFDQFLVCCNSGYLRAQPFVKVGARAPVPYGVGATGFRVFQWNILCLPITTACFKNVTNLILNNFNKLQPSSIIFVHHIRRIFLQITIIFSYLTSRVSYLLYLAISHSGINDLSPLRHLFHRV